MTTGSKIQRRNFYRLKCVLNIEFEWTDRGKIIREFGETFDISGSGIAFDHNCILAVDDKIKIFIDVGGKKIETLAKIVARDDLSTVSKHRYRYRITYVDIKKKAQDTIIDYVWKEQLRNTKH